MLELRFTARFKKDYRKAKKQGRDLAKLHEALDILCQQSALPERMRDHSLAGNYVGLRECHIEPDWLLVYYVDDEQIVLTAVRTGSHSDLLK